MLHNQKRRAVIDIHILSTNSCKTSKKLLKIKTIDPSKNFCLKLILETYVTYSTFDDSLLKCMLECRI